MPSPKRRPPNPLRKWKTLSSIHVYLKNSSTGEFLLTVPISTLSGNDDLGIALARDIQRVLDKALREAKE